MAIDVSQRWRAGRDGFVIDTDRGVFNPMGYEVVHVRSHANARAFVMEHHYSGTWRGGGEVFELRHGPRLVGVSVYAQPGGAAVLPAWFPAHAKTSLELVRLVMLDEVPFNAETWKLARDREILWREGYTGVVSFSDPMPRDLAAGGFIFCGHVGTTYGAASAIYTGQTGRETQWLFGDGSVFPSRCRTKIRAYAAGAPHRRCQGWEYASARLVAHGAPPFMFAHGDLAAADWCDEALGALARKRSHPGQHRYLWAKRGAARRDLERHLEELGVTALPYPEIDPAIVAAKINMLQRVRGAIDEPVVKRVADQLSFLNLETA